MRVPHGRESYRGQSPRRLSERVGERHHGRVADTRVKLVLYYLSIYAEYGKTRVVVDEIRVTMWPRRLN